MCFDLIHLLLSPTISWSSKTHPHSPSLLCTFLITSWLGMVPFLFIFALTIGIPSNHVLDNTHTINKQTNEWINETYFLSFRDTWAVKEHSRPKLQQWVGPVAWKSKRVRVISLYMNDPSSGKSRITSNPLSSVNHKDVGSHFGCVHDYLG